MEDEVKQIHYGHGFLLLHILMCLPTRLKFLLDSLIVHKILSLPLIRKNFPEVLLYVIYAIGMANVPSLRDHFADGRNQIVAGQINAHTSKC